MSDDRIKFQATLTIEIEMDKDKALKDCEGDVEKVKALFEEGFREGFTEEWNGEFGIAVAKFTMEQK